MEIDDNHVIELRTVSQLVAQRNQFLDQTLALELQDEFNQEINRHLGALFAAGGVYRVQSLRDLIVIPDKTNLPKPLDDPLSDKHLFYIGNTIEFQDLTVDGIDIPTLKTRTVESLGYSAVTTVVDLFSEVFVPVDENLPGEVVIERVMPFRYE